MVDKISNDVSSLCTCPLLYSLKLWWFHDLLWPIRYHGRNNLLLPGLGLNRSRNFHFHPLESLSHVLKMFSYLTAEKRSVISSCSSHSSWKVRQALAPDDLLLSPITYVMAANTIWKGETSQREPRKSLELRLIMVYLIFRMICDRRIDIPWLWDTASLGNAVWRGKET